MTITPDQDGVENRAGKMSIDVDVDLDWNRQIEKVSLMHRNDTDKQAFWNKGLAGDLKETNLIPQSNIALNSNMDK